MYTIPNPLYDTTAENPKNRGINLPICFFIDTITALAYWQKNNPQVNSSSGDFLFFSVRAAKKIPSMQ